MYKIIPYEQQYRDDTIFCLLTAKDALGRIPVLDEDVLDIQSNYFDKGDMFWLAIDEEDRVIGMLGTDTVSDADLWLRRLFLKPSMKRRGLGSSLLVKAEDTAKSKGVATIHTRFPDDFIEASWFYPAKGFVEVERHEGMRHFIKQT